MFGLARRRVLAAAMVIGAGMAWASVCEAATEFRPVRTCESLMGLKVPSSQIRLPTGGAIITSAKLVGAEGQPGAPDYVPEHCAIRGETAPLDTKASAINFGLVLPTAWNGNAMQIGGNGMLGFVPWLAALNRDGAGSPAGPTYPLDAPYPIARGYATYGGDGGHKLGNGLAPGRPGGVPPSAGQATIGGAPPGPPDYSWAANRETWLNFAYEHVRKDHDVAMAVIRAMYGRGPQLNYYAGESHGGRQAMEAIGRYPQDYDGVLVSVPLSNLAELWLYDLRNLKAQLPPGAWIPQPKLRAIEAETLRQCDALDGLKDGVVMNYVACTKAFDPLSHPDALAAIRCPSGADTGQDCLSDAQIAAVNTFRSPVRLPYALAGGATSYPGSPVGSEATHNWIPARAKPDPSNPSFGFLPLFRILLAEPNLTVAALDPERFGAKLKTMSAELDPPTDWTRFFAKGGKVIFHGASNDYTTNGNGQIAAAQGVEKQVGEVAFARGMRVYVTPGGDHGSRSFSFPDKVPQARRSDLLGALIGWVEHGDTPPNALSETLTDAGPAYALIRSRPLCRYPTYPRYKGAGDPNQATSFVCAAP